MRAKGFTLLEVMIAIAIMAMIGLGTASLLETVRDSKSGTDEKRDQINNLTRTIQLMDADLSQLVFRKIRDEYGDSRDPLMVSTGTYQLELTRTGWRNPTLNSRSNLQRVAYGLTADGELNRYFWLVLDRSEDSEPIVQKLLENVTDFRVSVVDEDNTLSNSWPESGSQSSGSQKNVPSDPSSKFSEIGLLPPAVKITLDLKGMGEVSRIINLVSP